MKKILVKSLITMYAILFLIRSADARNLNSLVVTGHDSPYITTKVTDLNNVNVKAANDFKARFNNPAGTEWFTDKNGFISYFKKEGFTEKVGYDKKGNWQYSMIYYTESKLPKDVRASVKSVYYDMAINLVEEVQTRDAKVYIVQLEDNTTIRIVKVNDQGEMEIIQEITK